MTYYTIEIRDNATNFLYHYTNIRNLSFAHKLAARLSRGFRTTDIIDQTTGAILGTYEGGEATYIDCDPYAGY